MPDRISDWQALVAQAVSREPIMGGVALQFGASPELARRSPGSPPQDCCTFFTFTLQMTTGQLRLEVQAPDDAADVVAAMFGPP